MCKETPVGGAPRAPASPGNLHFLEVALSSRPTGKREFPTLRFYLILEKNDFPKARHPLNGNRNRGNTLARACAHLGQGACLIAQTRANATCADARDAASLEEIGCFGQNQDYN